MRPPANSLLMYLVLVCHLLFPEAARASGPPRPAFEVRRVVSVRLESSWRNLTDTATVQLPGRWYFRDQQVAIKDWLQRGDQIEISLGYDQKLVKEFTGYVTDVSPRVPVTISCENEMYRLKKTPVNISYKAVRLPQLLKDICPPGTRIDALDVDLGHFKATKATVAKVLEKLREQYGFVSYYQNGVLHCGRVYRKGNPGSKARFSLERDVLADRLDYRSEHDLKVRVKATSHLLDGKRHEVLVGDVNDPDAEERTLQYFGIATEADLRTIATNDVAKLKVAGYKGSFSTFGMPHLQHGDPVGLTSSEYPERDGDFFIDAIAKSFEAGGYRQEITLGSSASLYGLQS